MKASGRDFVPVLAERYLLWNWTREETHPATMTYRHYLMPLWAGPSGHAAGIIEFYSRHLNRSENTECPSDFKFYSSAYSDTKFSVCYLSNQTFTYCEMNHDNRSWVRYDIPRAGLSFAYCLFLENKSTMILLCSGEDAGFFELRGGELMNGSYLDIPGGSVIKAADVLSDHGHSYLAISQENKRVHFYDLKDDFKNNIFDCDNITDDDLYLVKSNAIYIMLSGSVLEVSDREKFSDTHFFPQVKNGTRPVTGGADSETILGIFKTEHGFNRWDYKF